MSLPIRGALVLALASGGCGTDPEVAATFTMSDSAGVSIVTSTAPAWGDSARWMVDAEPMLHIGGGDGADQASAFFQDIAAVRLLASGAILALVGEDRSVRWYDTTGVEQRRIGRSGEGPGEFRNLRLAGLAADSILIWDGSLDRATMLDPSGQVIRVIRLEIDPALSWRENGFHVHGVLTDGRMLLVSQTVTSSTEASGLRRDTLPVGVAHPDGRLERMVTSLPGDEWQVINGEGFITGNPRPFGAKTRITTDGATILVAIGDRAGAERWGSDGARLASYRIVRPQRPLAPEDIEAHRARFGSEPEAHPIFAAIVRAQREVALPSHFAEHDQVVVDASGAIWLRRDVGPYADPAAPREWTILDREGRWLGTVYTPPALAVHQITADRLVGVWRDDSDLEYIRVYRLHR